MQETTMSRPSNAPAAAVILSVLAGFASARIDEPRFAVTSLTLVGPTSIPNGQSRPYTLHVTTERVERGAPVAALEAAQPLTRRVRPGLFANGIRLDSIDVELARLHRAGSLQLTLSCTDNEVRGSDSGSGAGARARSEGRLGLPWWDKPATVRARLNNLESNSLSVLCVG
jgi:hypothetical protein